MLESTPEPIPRRAQTIVEQALVDTPVVVVEGARQVSKSTLPRRYLATDLGACSPSTTSKFCPPRSTTPPPSSSGRQRSGSEVDIVLETPDRRVAGIKVKASSTMDPRDFRWLQQLATMAGPRFSLGAVLHTGKHALRFGPKMWALPVSALRQ